MKSIRGLPRNEAFSFIMPSAYLTLPNKEIVNCIKKIYREWRLRYKVYDYFPWYDLAANVVWKWRDNNVNTLPKRLSQELYKFNKATLSSSFWGNLGNELREKIPMSPQFVVRIADRFDWTAGAFGDHGSCMFESRSATKNAMAASGKFLALQTFSTVNENPSAIVRSINNVTYYGQSRCWVYPTEVTIGGKDEMVILIFNSYGPVPLQQLAIIVQGLTEAEATKRIKVSNQGNTSGGIYVNSGGGILIGSQNAIDNINHLDFSFKNSYDGRNRLGYTPVYRETTRTNTGAIVGLGENKTKAKKAKPSGPAANQMYEREVAKREILSAYKQMKWQKQKEDDIQFMAMTAGGTLQVRRTMQRKTKARQLMEEKGRFQNLVLKLARKRNLYRGSTTTEQEMFYSNATRIRELMYWNHQLVDQFPRRSKEWVETFKKNLHRNKYNIWSWMTYQLKQIIKEV